MAVLECVFVMCLRLRVEKWDPHSGCNALCNAVDLFILEGDQKNGAPHYKSQHYTLVLDKSPAPRHNIAPTTSLYDTKNTRADFITSQTLTSHFATLQAVTCIPTNQHLSLVCLSVTFAHRPCQKLHIYIYIHTHIYI